MSDASAPSSRTDAAGSLSGPGGRRLVDGLDEVPGAVAGPDLGVGGAVGGQRTEGGVDPGAQLAGRTGPGTVEEVVEPVRGGVEVVLVGADGVTRQEGQFVVGPHLEGQDPGLGEGRHGCRSLGGRPFHAHVLDGHGDHEPDPHHADDAGGDDERDVEGPPELTAQLTLDQDQRHQQDEEQDHGQHRQPGRDRIALVSGQMAALDAVGRLCRREDATPHQVAGLGHVGGGEGVVRLALVELGRLDEPGVHRECDRDRPQRRGDLGVRPDLLRGGRQRSRCPVEVVRVPLAQVRGLQLPDEEGAGRRGVCVREGGVDGLGVDHQGLGGPPGHRGGAVPAGHRQQCHHPRHHGEDDEGDGDHLQASRTERSGPGPAVHGRGRSGRRRSGGHGGRGHRPPASFPRGRTAVGATALRTAAGRGTDTHVPTTPATLRFPASNVPIGHERAPPR